MIINDKQVGTIAGQAAITKDDKHFPLNTCTSTYESKVVHENTKQCTCNVTRVLYTHHTGLRQFEVS